MTDIKSAYEILGLKEGVTKDEISRRYDILSKKRHTSQLNGSQEADSDSFDQISAAYNTLMNLNETGFADDSAKNKEYAILKRFGINQKKIENFFYHYKYHVIIGLIFLICTITLISIERSINVNLRIMCIGNFTYDRTQDDVLKDRIKKNVPGLKKLYISGTFLTGSEDEMEERIIGMLTQANIDVYILDETSFMKCVKYGFFMNLDAIADEMKVDKDKNGSFILSPEGKPDEGHLYGIDVSGSSLLDGNILIGNEKIIALSSSMFMNKQNAINFLRAVLKDLQ